MADNDNKSLPNEARRDEALKNLDKAIKGRDRRAKVAPLGVVAATLAVIVVLVGGIWFAATYTSTDEDAIASSDESTSSPEVEPAALPDGPLEPYGETVECTYPAGKEEASKEVTPPEDGEVKASGTTKVTLKTNQGDVPLELDSSKSPCTVNSFEHLAKEGFFNDTVCHRSVKSEGMGILQCGDPTGSGTGGPGYTFADEFPTNGVQGDETQNPVTYPRGTLAMANSGENTNGSQFFLVNADTTLPPAYNVFGTISEEGLKTLDAIAEKAPEGDGKPAEEVKIEEADVA